MTTAGQSHDIAQGAGRGPSSRCTPEEAVETVDEPEPEPLPPQVQKLLGDTTWDEYVAMDNGTVTTAVVEDNWEMK